MEKRLLVAIFLTFLVLYGYQVFVVKPAQEAAAKAKAAAGEAAARSEGEARATAPEAGAKPSEGAARADGIARSSADAVTPVVSEGVEREIVVETQTIVAVFSNRGGRLKSWKLKKYRDLGGHPQQLVPTYLGSEHARPFDLKVDDEGINERLKAALFKVEGVGEYGIVDGRERGARLVFEYRDSSGLGARKELGLGASGYIISVNAKVEGAGREWNPTVLWGPGLGDQIPGAGGTSYVQRAEGIIVRGDKVERIDAGKLREQPIREGEATAGGVDTHYFIAMALPTRMMRLEYSTLTLPAPAGMNPKNTTELVAFGVRQAKAMEGVRFFFGPKDYDVLGGVDRRLVRVINYGIFDFLVVPLLRSLKWVQGYVGNYGWSIIVLTVIINALMFPLRHRSMVSMRKMQEVQPLVKAIQDRYANLKMGDPARQKMNGEVMSLYKEKGVNPVGGCLPMVLTMPVLFAFYSLLSQAIEIRGEPFVFWIRDLSAHDPYYVTPILMGASQLIQQWMTPTSADPMQQRMMLVMPAVFTFMFLWMPSGLVVYWFASNLLAIGQQYMTNRMLGPIGAGRGGGPRPKAA